MRARSPVRPSLLAVVSVMLALVAPAVMPASAGAQAGAQAVPFRRLPDPGDLALPRRAPLTFTPAITITEEYNDNIFLDNNNKHSDFITGFSPGFTLEGAGPTYSLSASYFFTAEIFAKNPDLNHAFDRQSLSIDALYRVDPRLTLTFTELFTFDTNTNVVGTSDVATGRDRSWSNLLGLGASWLADPRTTLRGGFTWAAQRYDASDLIDSDVYRLTVGAERVLMPRLTGGLSYEFAIFDFKGGGQEDVTAHTPRLGVTYRFTPTLTGSISAGPIFEVPDHSDSTVDAAVTVSLVQRMSWGSAGVFYDRGLGTGGGLGGTTINQTVGALVEVRTLVKGLTLDFGPRYSIVNSSRGSSIDVDSVTVPLSATYRFTPWAAVVATYQFFHQRSDSTATTTSGTAVAADADQNRLWFGVQFGYPFRFD